MALKEKRRLERPFALKTLNSSIVGWIISENIQAHHHCFGGECEWWWWGWKVEKDNYKISLQLPLNKYKRSCNIEWHIHFKKLNSNILDKYCYHISSEQLKLVHVWILNAVLFTSQQTVAELLFEILPLFEGHNPPVMAQRQLVVLALDHCQLPRRALPLC